MNLRSYLDVMSIALVVRCVMIQFKCSDCGGKIKAKDEAAGKKGKCPQCGAMLKIPTPPKDASSADVDTLPKQSEQRPPIRRDNAKQPHVLQPPPLESGHVAQAPPVNINAPKHTSSLGVVSLILGIVALFFCWIPIIGLLSIPVGALGGLFACIAFIIALTRGGSDIGWSIGGGAVSMLALAIGMAQAAAIGGVTDAIAAGRAQPDTLEWASARSAVRHGDIELRVTDVFAGKVPLRSGFDDREASSKDDLLAIHLEMTNHTQNKKIEYRSWLGRVVALRRSYATLQDNFGNSYNRIRFGVTTQIVGHTASESIYPGESLGDILVFELPIETVEYLNLELPAENFGGEGMLRLQIPADMIQRG